MSHHGETVYEDDLAEGSDGRTVSDQVMALANSILAELQRVMDTYQIESHDFSQLTSLVTSTLEELDFAVSEKSKATIQLEEMEVEMSQLFLRLTEEREARHAADERSIALEDNAGGEKRKLETRIQQLETERRQLLSRVKNKEYHVSRLEEDREEMTARFKERTAKDMETINRYARQVEQLKAMEDVRARSSSLLQKRLRAGSSATPSKPDEKRKGTAVEPAPATMVPARSVSMPAPESVIVAENTKPNTISLDVPLDKTRSWKTELFSPTTEQLSGSPVISVPIVGSIAEETRHEEMDKEDEAMFAQKTVDEQQRNAKTLSEEFGMADSSEIGESEVVETNLEGYSSSHLEEMERLRDEKQEVESQRLQLTLQKAELSHKVDNMKSEVSDLHGQLKQKEESESQLEKTVAELRADLKRFREERMSPEEGYRRSKSGQRLRYTKTELDTVLKQYHFYKEKTHDLEEELRRVKTLASQIPRRQSGIRKFFSKLFGIKSSPPRRHTTTTRQHYGSKTLSVATLGGQQSRMPIDPDSYVITNSWKVGHGGIIDPMAPPLPLYHSNIAVPEAGVRLQSVVSVCCPSEPVSKLSELRGVPHRIFLWMCTISNDEASQIHVVDVTLPSRNKIVENFLVSDSKVPSMAFVPTVALKNMSSISNSPENAEEDPTSQRDRTSSETVPVEDHPLMAPTAPKERGHVASTFFHSSVWVGTESGWIYVYSTVADPGRQLLVEDMANSVRCIKFLFDAVFAGIGDGTLAVFRPSAEACCGWDLANHKRIPLESKSLVAQTSCMTPVEGQLWVGCGNMINIVNPHTMQLETAFTVSQRLSAEVMSITCIGDVVAVSVAQSSSVSLFHSRSTQQLQDVDVTPLCNIIDKETISPIHPAHVTCMMAVNGLLWVGTASGVVLTLDFSNPTITHRNSRHDVLEIRARRREEVPRRSGEKSPSPNADGFIEVLDPRFGKTPSLPPICSYGDARMSCFGHLNGVNSFVGVRCEEIDRSAMRQEGSPLDGDDTGLEREYSWIFSGGFGFVDLYLENVDERRARRRTSTLMQSSRLSAARQGHPGQPIDERYDSQQFLFWRL